MAINRSFPASRMFLCHSSPAFLSSSYYCLHSYCMANKSSVSSYLKILISMRKIDLIKHLWLCQMKYVHILNHAALLSTGLFAHG